MSADSPEAASDPDVTTDDEVAATESCHAGSTMMPAWNVGELPEPPRFSTRDWAGLLGPGLVMAGAAIGGGEWVSGPLVTARYGGSLLWLATLSILGQVIYNVEISRYTLYTGEPIFTGKFRVLPGPIFWMALYLLLDFGSVFPYLASNAATPLAAILLGHIADADRPGPAQIFGWTAQLGSLVVTEKLLMQILSYVMFFTGVLPLLVGGKIYNSVKVIMSIKIFFVFGFLLFLAFFFSSPSTWIEIGSGFFKFGNVPIVRGEDLNGNGILDPGEDWDGDGHLDVLEQRIKPTIDSDGDGKPDRWEDHNGDGVVDSLDKFEDVDGDGYYDGDNVTNVFVDLATGKGFPAIDWTVIGILGAMAAISGSGGLTNTTVSAYTREQGWGMGRHVGAIPSLFGGHKLQLSHSGTVFRVTAESLVRWRKWVAHVWRDQAIVWMPGCFVGLGLPAMLSIVFLRRGTDVDEWQAAAMTAQGVGDRVGEMWGSFFVGPFFYMTLACGVLVLWPSVVSSIDGFLRRWVDVIWVGLPAVRKWDPRHIGTLYSSVLLTYAVFGAVILYFGKPKTLLEITTTFYNFALGVSCWHALAVNTLLLPKELRPRLASRIGLILAGMFFFGLGVMMTLAKFKQYGWL